MLRERRGTCSTKHLFLAGLLAERCPETDPTIMHRVYVLDRARAGELFGRDVAEVVPEMGLTDVHRYLTIKAADQISQASLSYEKEQNPDSFNEPLAKFDTRHRLLDAIGWSNETRTIQIEDEQRGLLATALQERVVADREHVADPVTGVDARETTEHDVYAVEGFLAVNGLTAGG